MVGKVRLALTPLVNHWWNVPLYVNSRGLTTSAIPYGKGAFEIQFDFLRHILEIQTCDARAREIALKPRSVAEFYREFMKALASLDIRVKIWPMPVEIPNPIRFDQDTVHASYDPEYANRFWRALVSTEAVLHEFRARFVGKVESRAFLLGKFRLGGHAILRPSCPRTSWSGFHDARGVFA